MEEKELIKLLKSYRKVKPDKNWKRTLKFEILGRELDVFPFKKPLYALSFSLLLLLGILQSAQNSLPGDPLYFVKKLSEETKLSLLKSPDEKAPVLLDLTQKKANELATLASTNQVQKLVPAIKEFQEKANKTAQVLKQTQTVSKKDLQKVVSVLQSVKSVEKSLGTELSPPEFDKVVEEKVKLMIKDLETRSLTPEETSLLESAKEDLEKGEIEKAFEKVISIFEKQD